MAALYDFDVTLTQVMAEIDHDIEQGVVPPTVASFSELHDHVDANCYGGAEGYPAEDFPTDRFCNFWNRVQNAADAWLRGKACAAG